MQHETIRDLQLYIYCRTILRSLGESTLRLRTSTSAPSVVITEPDDLELLKIAKTGARCPCHL